MHEIKCSGNCGAICDDITGFATFSGREITEWICEECWATGHRSKATRVAREDKDGNRLQDSGD